MRQLIGPKLTRSNPQVLKAARGVVIVAALVYLMMVAVARVVLVVLALACVLGLVAGLVEGSVVLVILSCGSIFLISRLPRTLLTSSVPTFLRVAIPLFKFLYQAGLFLFPFAFFVGISRQDGALLDVGLFGFIACVACRIVEIVLMSNPYRIRHIAGTTLEDEREIIQRAQEIREHSHR